MSEILALDHAYTNQALAKLADATNAMAKEIGFELPGDMQKVKEHADKIPANPLETTHADLIRGATDILSASLLKRAV